MTSVIVGLGLAILGGLAETSADTVTLRDGQVVLGQVLEPERRGGPLPVVIRRAWAKTATPARFDAWRKIEEPLTRRAESQRINRLKAWRQDRPRDPGKDDRITAWLETIIQQPARGEDQLAPLMLVRINRADIKTVKKQPVKTGRLLRLAWTIDLADPETMPLEDLREALEGRGFAPNLDTPVSLDALLPIPVETDDRWLLRRAATEVTHDSGSRFLRYQGLLMPEPAPGEPPAAAATISSALDAVKGLLGDAPAPDPLPARLREVGARGGTGAVVTELEMAADLSAVAVRVTLWVRTGNADRWVVGLTRAGTANPNTLSAQAGAGLAEDPQVKAAFNMLESMGLGSVPEEYKQKSLVVGAATRMALNQARAAIDQDLKDLSIPLTPPAGTDARVAPRP